MLFGKVCKCGTQVQRSMSPHRVKTIVHKINYVNGEIYILNSFYDSVKMKIFHQEIKMLMKKKTEHSGLKAMVLFQLHRLVDGRIISTSKKWGTLPSIPVS